MSDGGSIVKVVIGAVLGAGVVVVVVGAAGVGWYLGTRSHKPEVPASGGPVTVAPNPTVPAPVTPTPSTPAGNGAVPDLAGQVSALDTGTNLTTSVPPSRDIPPTDTGTTSVTPTPTPPVQPNPVAVVPPPPKYDFRDLTPPSPQPVEPVVVGAPQVEVVDVNAFARDLTPMGDWVDVREYGHCWRPRGLVGGWRPYTVGRWVYTEYGLTWVSEERWGPICYHYGAWIEDPRWGWVWVPGRVWAPAWVAWRSGDDYIGWAPLPPQFCTGRRRVLEVDVAALPAGNFCFVSAGRMMDDRMDRHVRPVRENAGFVKGSVNVTNIGISVGGVVINASLDVKRVEGATHHKVEQVTFERGHDWRDADKWDKNKPVIYAPAASAKVDTGHDVHDKGPGKEPVHVVTPPVLTKEQIEAARKAKEAADAAAAEKAKQDAWEKMKADELAKQKAAEEKAKQDAWEKMKADELAKQRAAADKAKADKLAADKAAADKAKLEAINKAKADAAAKAAAEKAAADKALADKLAADKAAADKAAADKAAADKALADKLAADKAAADKAAADKARLDAEKTKKDAAELTYKQQLEAAKLKAQQDAAEKAAADKAAADKARSDAIEKAKADAAAKAAAERAKLDAAEKDKGKTGDSGSTSQPSGPASGYKTK